MTRAVSTLLGAGVAGFLLWLAAQVGRETTGGYWAALGIVAAAGLAFGLSQLRGRDGHPPGMLVVAFLPALVVAGWVLIGMQPNPNWFRDHVLAWSGSMHIRGVVDDLGTWYGVLALGLGLLFGLTLEPGMLRRRGMVARPAPEAAPIPTTDAGATTATTRRPAVPGRRAVPAADEPLTAERREVETAPVGGREA